MIKLFLNYIRICETIFTILNSFSTLTYCDSDIIYFARPPWFRCIFSVKLIALQPIANMNFIPIFLSEFFNIIISAFPIRPTSGINHNTPA
jgi:hypothetical protein